MRRLFGAPNGSEVEQTMRIVLYMICTISLRFNSCAKDEPCTVCPTKPEFSWSIDTLRPLPFQRFVPKQIWGSSPNDVWAVGFDEYLLGEMMHFDGTKWSRVSPNNQLAPLVGSASMDFTGIYGFGKDNIYVVGYTFSFSDPTWVKGFVIHYNGVQWAPMPIDSSSSLYFVHGNSPINIWASGRRGNLFHFDGISWTRTTLDTSYDYGPIAALTNGVVFSIAEKYPHPNDGDSATTFVHRYLNTSWEKFDSVRVVNKGGILQYRKFGHSALWADEEGLLYSAGWGLYKLAGN